MCPKTRKILTLTLIRDSSRILLGLKKKGFGQGKWNGFGGKVESGETIEDAAKRELKEESSLTANELIKVGIIGFEFEGETEMMEVHIFTATEFTGEPKESEEMKPRWFNLDAIPFDEMWADDRIWFPLLLKGSCFFGFFKFRGHDTIINYTLREMDQTSFRKLFVSSRSFVRNCLSLSFTETSAEVELQDLLNHTAERILHLQSEV